MKYRLLLLIPSAFIIMALAGCQQSAAPEAGTPSEDDTKGKLLIDQVMPDGSEERVMEIDLDNTKPVDISMTGNVKDMVLDQDGFSPSELTIKAGTKVIFESRGEEDHWPASGNHPTHEICEGLDAGKALSPGEIYEYTFTEVEECPIHDHLNPELTGKITVIADE